MRVAFLLVSGLLLAAPAAAEDFTGFYAGVNAGYGFQRDRKSREPVWVPAPGPGASAADGLPPSAAGALRAMAGSRPNARQGAVLPQ
ncbi:hypothetical protein [Methylobacterium soli]|uniref:Porin family protein n=1 Tax=Methylobacterium soli TaxID=553447 RepID=A0A6L3T8R8_9HYPH|nr:hypothetical protein [Methylobacterium soli]KAB1081857.1 hypothetical protein F6X53_01815 [Methylobacterium soli]GJE43234.1 hypothetical protein AEGHOMDF_2413 [Methylobacterium soli]